MSTNGYLSTDLDEFGGDLGNICMPEEADGKIYVLHNDFEVIPGGGLRRAYFATCPRPGDAVGANAGCTVFMWTGLRPFGAVTGNAEFQAILYDLTFEIVYQYRLADPANGAFSTVGVRSSVTRQTQYSCDQAREPAGRAVCLFHPSAPPL